MIYCHIIGTHLGNSGRERRGERDIPLFEKDLREMDPSSVERERGGKEGRIAGEYRVRCRSSTMRMAGWERGHGHLVKWCTIQYRISSEADPIERKRNATQDEWGH